MNNDLIIKRGAASKIADEPIVDGALLLDKESGALYADIGNERLEVGAIAKNDAVFESNVTVQKNATIDGNADVKGTVVATSIVAKSSSELGNTSCMSLTTNSATCTTLNSDNATCENLTISESMTINAPYVSANRIEGTSVNLPSENDFLVDETSFKSLLLDAVYPIGSLYWSRNETDPSTLFGGTWKRIKDKFILAAGDAHTVGTTGGKEKVALTENEIPSHSHGTARLVNTIGAGTYIEVAGGGDYGFYIGYDSTGGKYVDSAATGGNQAHNNMPPYDTFYCWERINPSTETGNEQ